MHGMLIGGGTGKRALLGGTNRLFVVWFVSVVAVASVFLQAGCRKSAKSGSKDRPSKQPGQALLLPVFVPARAVGLGLADGPWLVRFAARVSKMGRLGDLGSLIHRRLHIDIARVRRVWIVWFAREQAGPLLFDPVVVAEGARMEESWDGKIAGRPSKSLMGQMVAVDCGAHGLCVGRSQVVAAVVDALGGKDRARKNSDFWAGVARFLAGRQRGFASVMNLRGRFDDGPGLVQLALGSKGKLVVELAGCRDADATQASVKQLLARARRAIAAHVGMPEAPGAASIIERATLRHSGTAVVLELPDVSALLAYFLAPNPSDGT